MSSDNVVEFPGSFRPEHIVDRSPLQLDTTEGYERHQAELRQWLFLVADQVDTSAQAQSLSTLAERYGIPIEDDATTAWARVLSEKDPRDAAIELQRAHLSAVISSPTLSILQKLDLLTISSAALGSGKLPADGRKIVLGTLKRSSRSLDSYARDNGITGTTAYTDTREHFSTLTSLVEESLPKLSRREFYKRAASSISGERVTNIFKAAGILLAELDAPSPREITKATERHNRRRHRATESAERRMYDAMSEYHELVKDKNDNRPDGIDL